MTERPYQASAWSYLIGEIVYIGPCTTYRGIGSRIENHPVRSAKLDSVEELEKMIRAALSEFEGDVAPPFPDVTKRLPQPILQAAKLKSFKALIAVGKSVDIVEWKDKRVEFGPSRNEGPRMGYSPIFPGEIAENEQDLAHALRRAFDRCE
jgi:hypothetical protein